MCAAVVVAASADVTRAIPPSALLFTFEPTSATTGDVIFIRMTTRGKDRVRALRRPIRLYLAPKSSAPSLRTRFDPWLHFVGAMVRGSGGKLRSRVPPLDTGDYVAAAWCPGCASLTGGRTFFAFTPGPNPSPRLRAFWLNVQLPSAAETCPVTLPRADRPPPGLAASPSWHGNGFLWTGLPRDGVFVPRPDDVQPDGSVGTKWFWFAAHVDGSFVLKGRRLDADSPPLVVHRVNRGTMTGFRGSGTWATPITFPSAGCWRLIARVADVSLSFVLRVET